MKRLTKIYPSGSYGIVGDIDDAVHRLAAIEDILGEEYDLERLRELVEVRHGRWEMAPCNGVYDMRCSACGFCPGIRFFSSNYCPDCGALMGKEDEHD